MLRIGLIVLTAILAGCASAPSPMQEQDARTAFAYLQRSSTQTPPNASTVENLNPLQAQGAALRARVVDSAEQHCLAQAMYWEARGEGRDGMIAVSSVILNRVEDSRFPATVCGVVYEGGERPPCQFSWWCDGKSDEPANPRAWALAVTLAHEILATPPDDPTDGALFYHANSIPAPWRRQPTTRIGRHIFYR